MSGPPLEDLTGRWDYLSLPANVIIGEGCYLERRESFSPFRSRRDPGLVIGERVAVYTWAGFGVEEEGLLEIGDDCVLAGPLFMCADHIRVGNGVVISYNVTIADSDFHPLALEARRRDALAIAPGGDRAARPTIETAPVSIGDGAWIGIGATVLKGVSIGAGARVGAGSVVTSDVRPGETVQGNPARAVVP